MKFHISRHVGILKIYRVFVHFSFQECFIGDNFVYILALRDPEARSLLIDLLHHKGKRDNATEKKEWKKERNNLLLNDWEISSHQWHFNFQREFQPQPLRVLRFFLLRFFPFFSFFFFLCVRDTYAVATRCNERTSSARRGRYASERACEAGI